MIDIDTSCYDSFSKGVASQNTDMINPATLESVMESYESISKDLMKKNAEMAEWFKAPHL